MKYTNIEIIHIILYNFFIRKFSGSSKEYWEKFQAYHTGMLYEDISEYLHILRETGMLFNSKMNCYDITVHGVSMLDAISPYCSYDPNRIYL